MPRSWSTVTVTWGSSTTSLAMPCARASHRRCDVRWTARRWMSCSRTGRGPARSPRNWPRAPPSATRRPSRPSRVRRRPSARTIRAQGRTFVETHLRSALPPEEEARVLLTIAGMFALSPDVRIDADHRALALEGVSQTGRARHHAALFHNFLVAGRFDEGRAVLEVTREVVRASHDGVAAFSLLVAEAALEYVDGNFIRSVELMQQAMRSPAAAEDPARARLSQLMRSEALMVAERFDKSVEVTNEGIADAEQHRQGWAHHMLETWRGVQLFQLGLLDDAVPVLEGQLGPEEEDRIAGLLDAAGIVALGRVALHRGDDAQLHRTATLARTMVGEGPPGFRRHAAWLRALGEMAAGDRTSAHGWLCALGREERKSLLPLFPSDITDEAQLVRIALAAGDEELAA